MKKILLSVLAFSFITFPFFASADFWTSICAGGGGGGFLGKLCVDLGDGAGGGTGGPIVNPGLPEGSIMEIVATFMYWILGIFSFVSIIGFIISGILYLTAAGDESRAETAKDAMKWSIIGVIVGLGAFVIIQAIAGALGGSSDF